MPLNFPSDSGSLMATIIADLGGDKVISPEELTYWQARESRTFFIDYELSDDYSVMELGKAIIQLNHDEMSTPKNELKPIYIYIHSYGGDLEQCYALIGIIEASRIPIVTVSMGATMSAAFLLLLAGDKRYAFPYSSSMVHQGSAGFSGTANEVQAAQKSYERQLKLMKDYILRKTNIPEKLFNKRKKEDWYLSPEELLKYGAIDGIVRSFDELYGVKPGKAKKKKNRGSGNGQSKDNKDNQNKGSQDKDKSGEKASDKAQAPAQTEKKKKGKYRDGKFKSLDRKRFKSR